MGLVTKGLNASLREAGSTAANFRIIGSTAAFRYILAISAVVSGRQARYLRVS